MRIREPGWKKFESGIRDKHTGSATLAIVSHHAYVYLYIGKYLLIQNIFIYLFQAPRMGPRGGALVAAVLAVLVRAGNALCPASCHCQHQFTVVQCLRAGLEVRKYICCTFFI